jgi:hypothetical protein
MGAGWCSSLYVGPGHAAAAWWIPLALLCVTCSRL